MAIETGKQNSKIIFSDNEIIAKVLYDEKNIYAIIVHRYNQRPYRTAMSIINDSYS